MYEGRGCCRTTKICLLTKVLVYREALLDMSLFHFRNALLKQVTKSLVSAESSLKLISKAELRYYVSNSIEIYFITVWTHRVLPFALFFILLILRST